jgi:hypothetical protein
MQETKQQLWAIGLLAALILSACSSAATTPTAVPTQPAPQAVTAVPQPTSAPVPDSTFTPPPGSRGAATRWDEYEAEDGSTNGALLEPSRTFGEIAAESSGRRSVKLSAAGQYIQISATRPANSIVLRYAIPDAPEGGGITATLSLYVNDTFRQKLGLTSKYAWSYGGETQTSNDPSIGGAHHFFDEARALVGDIPAGAAIKLQQDSGDTAAYYVIDLIDMEQVDPPKPMPGGFLSISDPSCGATPDDGTDDSRAILKCVEIAKLRKQGIWIPAGTFESTTPLPDSQGIPLFNLTIRGAGMWHSILHGAFARFHCLGDNCRFYDFAILGETTLRDDTNPENGFNGGAGKGSRVENIWVEHTKVGWWVGAGTQNVTDGLVVTGSRFRNLFADGVNFCNGTSNSVVENSHFRNTGDDALASWAPAAEGGVNSNNVFRFNTVQLPWRANCFAIYGGKDNRIEDSLCYDTIAYPGVLIAQDFDSHPFAGTTTVQRSSLIRAGGPMWGQSHGALKIQARKGPIAGLAVQDLLIESSTFAGVELQGPFAIEDASFERIEVVDAGTSAIAFSSASGGATFDHVTATNSGSAESPGSQFTITRGAGNSGW